MHHSRKYCTYEGCSLNKELVEYQDVEIHYLFHFRKCLECNYSINQQTSINNETTLAKLLKEHQNSIRHTALKKRNIYFKRRFNSIIDYDRFYSSSSSGGYDGGSNGNNDLSDSGDEGSDDSGHEDLNYNNINSNSNNSIVKFKKKNNNSIKRTRDSKLYSDDEFKTNKKIKLDSSSFQKKDELKYVYTRLAEMNIPIETVQILFKDKKLVESLSNTTSKNLKDEFEYLDSNLPFKIFESKCNVEECNLCATFSNLNPIKNPGTSSPTIDLGRNHNYFAFDIIELLKSLLTTDLINDISFYPIGAGESYSLYSSSEHFFRIFNENSKALNILIKVCVDNEVIDGNSFNVVYISIANTVSSIVKKRFYLGCFPICVSFQEALVNILKPLFYSTHEEILATIKIPDPDPDTKSIPLPLDAIEQAIQRKNYYIKNKEVQVPEKNVKLGDEFFDVLFSYINIVDQDICNDFQLLLDNSKEDNDQDVNINNGEDQSSNMDSQQVGADNIGSNIGGSQIVVYKNQDEEMENDDEQCDGNRTVKYCELLNEKNDRFNRLMKTQELVASNNQNKYNNVGIAISNNSNQFNNSSDFSSFFSIAFTILDISGNNNQVSEVFSTFNKPNKVCSFCDHPKNEILDFTQNYEMVSLDKSFVPKFLSRVNEKMEDESIVKIFIRNFKEELGIDYSSIPLYLLNFKDLYNPIEITFHKELEIMFYELSFILHVITKRSEHNKVKIENKKYEQLRSIVNSINKFQIISFIEDTNSLVHFLIELTSSGILDKDHLKCFLLHLKYFFKLRKECVFKNDLKELDSTIIEHHQLFVEIYKNEIDGEESIYLNLHSSKHWGMFISLYGSAVYFSIVSYGYDELSNKKVNKSICESSCFIKNLENLGRQFNLFNEKVISSSNIILSKTLQNVAKKLHSSVTINGRKYKPNYFYSVYGTEECAWYCQIKSIQDSSITVRYFEHQEAKDPPLELLGVTQKAYLLDPKEYEISLKNNPESLLERVDPIILDGYYYFISSNNNNNNINSNNNKNNNNK